MLFITSNICIFTTILCTINIVSMPCFNDSKFQIVDIDSPSYYCNIYSYSEINHFIMFCHFMAFFLYLSVKEEERNQ